MTSTPEPIAVVGMACRLPGAPDLQAYWQLLLEGRDAVGPAPADRWPQAKTAFGGFLERIDAFDAAFFGLTAQEAAGMDPQQRLLLELSWEVLEDAGQLPGRLAGEAIGVFIGLSSADYYHTQLLAADQVDMYTISGAAASVSANRISYQHDFRGPSLVVDTACSSSLTAVHLACESLQRGECTQALAGGVNLLLSPLIHQGFQEAMALSVLGHCSAFAAEADGIVRGEGAGLVCLKPLARALADKDRIYALIRGSAMGQDGLTNGLSAPSPAGQRAVLSRAYAGSGVDPRSVAFVEAHGTGTPLGDPIEARSLADVVGKDRARPCRLGSVKSNLGHLEAAAGIAGLIKAVLALHHHWLPASLHADTPNPRIPFRDWGLQLQTQGEALETDSENPGDLFAGVSAFGFGGTNVHVVLQAIDPMPAATASSDPLAFALTARTATSLIAYRHQLALWLEREPEPDLPRLALTLAGRREAMKVRQALVAHDRNQLIELLRTAPAPLPLPRPRPKLAFLFSGMGSQEAGMGKALLGSAPFRQALEAADQVLLPWLETSLFDLLEQALDDPEYVQALLFAIQLALVAQWQAWGIRPDAVMGASMGEITAAVVAGILDPATAARLLCQRIRLLKTRIGTGHMAVVGLPAAELAVLLEAEPVWVAAVNGPALCVVAGEHSALERLLSSWQEQGIFIRPVRGASAPSHTPLMAPLAGSLIQAIGELAPREGTLPFWSTVLGQSLKGPELDAEYWCQNLSRPVSLYPTLQNMLADHDWVVVEISPHPVLTAGLQELESPPAGTHRLHILASLRRDAADAGPMLESLAELYALGFLPDWQNLMSVSSSPTAEIPLSLPAYAWEQESHWLAPPAAETAGKQQMAMRPQPGSAGSNALAPMPGLTREILIEAEADARQAMLAAHLQQVLARALRLEPAALPPEQPLKNLGIGSLVGMELYQRLKKELGISLALSDVLRGPSINELSSLILKHLAPQADSPAARPRPPKLPLSFTQQRFWFYSQLEPDSLSYHIPGALELCGALDLAQLRLALQKLVNRHEILRTVYPVDEHGQPSQKVLADHAVDFTLRPWADSLEPLIKAASEPFALESTPPFRLSLFSDGAQRHRLLIDLHHLVADGYSFKLLFAELARLYAGESLSGPVPQFADFALWQRDQAESGHYAEDLAFWRHELQGAPALLALPTDFPRPAQPGSAGRRHWFALERDLRAALEATARERGVTLYTLLVGAYLILLQRLSNSADLVIGTPVLGRGEPAWAEGIGPYLNMLPLRAELTGHASAGDFLLALQERILAGFDHQDVPFEQIVEALNPPRELAWHPIYQYVFALHAPISAEALDELSVQLLDLDLGISRFDLALTLLPDEHSLHGSVEYRSELFAPETIAAFVAAYLCLLGQLSAGQDRPLDELSLSRQALSPVLCGEARSLPPWRLGERIRAVAASQPRHPAVLDEASGNSLDYCALLERASAVATWLRQQACAKVAIALPRSPEMLIAWLGALMAGVTYIPLDPRQPLTRLRELVSEADAPIFIAPTNILEAAEFAVLPSTLAGETIAGLPAGMLVDSREAEVCYLIFTSGSSGKPKGVEIGPDSLLNLVAWHLDRYTLESADKCCLIANPGFDAAAWEVWPALAAGATICIPAPETVAEPERLKHWLATAGISVGFVPTPLLERLLASPWPQMALRALLTGGDRLSRRPPPGQSWQLHNHYGPTENTVVTSCCLVEAGESPPALGLPLPNMQLYLLDAAGQMLPPGLAGELWMGGTGLALGYQGQAVHPAFAETTAGRLYRSGDLMRLGPEGLHFLGRVDDQLKLRGVRIEPGEIEAMLRRHPLIAQAVVQLQQGQLLAWVSMNEHPVEPVNESYSETGIRGWLAQRLPEAFVPARIVVMEALPLTPRGKLDRQALPAPVQSQAQVTGSPLLQTLALIWAELLPGLPLAAEADFFALGGHSLMALDLRHRIQQRLGLELPLSELFRRPTLAGLARWLEDEAKPAPWPPLLADPESLHIPFPLSEIQQAYWIGRSAGMELGAVSAHAYLELDVPGLDTLRLEATIRRLIGLHPMLRAIITADGQQRILPEVPDFSLVLEDLRPLPAPEREARLAAIRASLSHEVRPADTWPLFGLQASLLPQAVRLHLSFDALMADATSLLLLARQLQQLYLDPATAIAPAQINFRDVILYERQLQQSARYARDRAYWLDRLESFPLAPALPIVGLPAGQPRFDRRSGRLDPEPWGHLKARAGALGVTPTVLLLSAFATVLGRWQDHAPLCLNLTTFHRLPIHEQLADLVGDFTRLTLLACELQPEDFAAQTLALQQRLLADLDHSLYSAVALMRELRARRGPDAARMPVVFTSLLGADAELPLDQLGANLVYSRTQTPQVWLDHQVAERAGALSYDWDFPAGLFPAGLIDALLSDYQSLLEWLSSGQDWQQPRPMLELPPAEAVHVDLLHAATVRQALASPEALAVICPSGSLSYGQLLARSMALAAQLGRLAADTPVAVWLEPGCEQAVAVLGILLAGGSYLPLNPAWPQARLQSLLARSLPAALVTSPDRAQTATELSPTPVLVPAADVNPADSATVLQRLQVVEASALAYIIFTSGSTGEPKGVMIEHRSAWNTVKDLSDRLQLQATDRILGLSELNFDLSVYDLFAPLAVGAALVYPDPAQAREPAHWLELCTQHRVSIWNTVPALMAMLTEYCHDHPQRRLPQLRTVLLSGDWIPLSLPGRIKQDINPATSVYSLGGATEAAIWSIWHPIAQIETDWKSIPYGQALGGQRVYVLDAGLA
ncbi:MAG: AMP-binding protein, partial [Candidatus Sericytochromatia bacterium]